jgi:hypothetical protein
MCSGSELNEMVASMKKIGSFWMTGGTMVLLPALYPASAILTSMTPSNVVVSVPKPHCPLQKSDHVGGRGPVWFVLQLDPKLNCYWAALGCQYQPSLVLHQCQSPAQ